MAEEDDDIEKREEEYQKELQEFAEHKSALAGLGCFKSAIINGMRVIKIPEGFIYIIGSTAVFVRKENNSSLEKYFAQVIEQMSQVNEDTFNRLDEFLTRAETKTPLPDHAKPFNTGLQALHAVAPGLKEEKLAAKKAVVKKAAVKKAAKPKK